MKPPSPALLPPGRPHPFVFPIMSERATWDLVLGVEFFKLIEHSGVAWLLEAELFAARVCILSCDFKVSLTPPLPPVSASPVDVLSGQGAVCPEKTSCHRGTGQVLTVIKDVPDFKILCQLMWLQGRNHFVMFLQVLMDKELKEAKRASKRPTMQACFKAKPPIPHAHL